MIDRLKTLFRNIHLDKENIKLNSNYRLNKKTFKIANVSKRVPNLILIGSQKCGTTSLYYYLSKHPEIAITSPFKESGYFCFYNDIQHYWKEQGFNITSKKKLLNTYMKETLSAQKYFLDASTYYTQEIYQLKANIAQNIKNESPNSKILYIIRNPFQRLISVYYHMLRSNHNTNHLNNLDDCVNWGTNFVETSLYYNRLKQYLDIFDKDQILILQLENLTRNPQQELNKVMNFLDIDLFTFDDFKAQNQNKLKRKETFSKETYLKLYPLFSHQKKLLEQHLNLTVNWDLSEEKWVG